MKNPKEIEAVAEGATYIAPIYRITDEGLEDYGQRIIQFVKGDKSNDKMHRQYGFMTESLLQVCKQYLEDVQKGHLADPYTRTAIKHIDEALYQLELRQKDRKERKVNQTYQK